MIPETRFGKIRFSVLIVFLLLVLIDLFLIPSYWTRKYKPREGDFIFQSLLRSELVKLIEGATNSEFSHVGILKRNEAGNWVVVESMGSVHETPLWEFIARGRMDHFAVYRQNPELSKYISGFETEMGKYYGRPYDFRYDMDADFIYCSELTYKACLTVSGIRLGKLTPMGELNWKPFEKTIRKMENGGLPLDRILISPINLAHAPELSLVFNNGYSGL